MSSAPTQIINATVITVSLHGPPVITTAAIEVDAFTSGGRRILSVDCTSPDTVFPGSGAQLPQAFSTSNPEESMKKDESMTADEVAFFQQVKERNAAMKDEGEGDMNLMDVDEKANPDEAVSRMTKKFRKVGRPSSSADRSSGDDGLGGRASPTADSPDGILIAYLRQIVHQDLQLPPSERIDTVRIKSPERYHWIALNGLSPKHLTLSMVTDATGDFASLDRLEQRWTALESLRLEDISDTLWDTEDWASSVSSVSAVTLAYCSSVRLVPEGGLPNLTRLRIIENDGLAMFVQAGEKVTGFSKRLEVLYLQSTNGSDAKGKADLLRFRNQLKKCTHLKVLTLVLARADRDTGLVQFIPSSVENLTFHCSCSLSMLNELEDWLTKPADRKWLPNIKSFTFKCDARTFDHRTNGTEGGGKHILDVPLPPVHVKREDDEQEGELVDLADLDAQNVLHGEDIEEDDDEDEDYDDGGIDMDDDDSDEDEEDEDAMKEEDGEEEGLDFGARDDHNAVLLPHITSIIGNVLHKLKERNPELQIVA